MSALPAVRRPPTRWHAAQRVVKRPPVAVGTERRAAGIAHRRQRGQPPPSKRPPGPPATGKLGAVTAAHGRARVVAPPNASPSAHRWQWPTTGARAAARVDVGAGSHRPTGPRRAAAARTR